MFSYIIGYVREVGFDFTVIESNGIGFHINIARPNEFRRDELIRVYTYFHVREDGMTLFGFRTKDDKNIFLRLIEVNGIGPKTAMNMLANIETSNLIQAIETGNTAILKKLPGIGPKAAQQIILDLKGKLVFDEYVNNETTKTNVALEEAKEALKMFGFRVGEIDSVLSKLGKETLTSEEYIKKALQMLRK